MKSVKSSQIENKFFRYAKRTSGWNNLLTNFELKANFGLMGFIFSYSIHPANEILNQANAQIADM